MLLNLFLIEQKKTVRRAGLWVGIGLLSSLVIMSMVAMAGSNPPADIVQRQIVWPMSLVLYLRQFAANSLLAGMIIVVLTALVVAQEYQWRTLNLILGRGVSRLNFLLAKVLSLLSPCIMVVLIPMLAGIIVSGFYTLHFNGFLDLGTVSFSNLAISILLGAYALLPYAALTVLLSVLSRSPTVALGGGIGFLVAEMIVWPLLNALGGVGKTIGQFFPISLSMAVLKTSQSIARVIPSGISGYEYWDNFELHTIQVAVLLIAIYTFIFLLCSYLSFLRQDIT